jgi:hypothetical protein
MVGVAKKYVLVNPPERGSQYIYWIGVDKDDWPVAPA